MTKKKKTSRSTPRYRVPLKESFSLDDVDPESTRGVKDKQTARTKLAAVHERLCELQEVLYAQAEHAVLVVLQAMDTGGKDSTIRHVFGPLNPQGVRVTSFKRPTETELAHDFLWRIHQAVPRRGTIGVFNRSHYEDVLVVKVHKLVRERVIRQRYAQINTFEKHLAENSVTILKFFLHISKDEQKQRLQKRLERPDKHWKFNSADLAERKLWSRYMSAAAKAVAACNTREARWHVVPGNHKWYRDLVIAETVCDALEDLDLRYPPPEADLEKIVIDA